jgi:hypothetical protein
MVIKAKKYKERRKDVGSNFEFILRAEVYI